MPLNYKLYSITENLFKTMIWQSGMIIITIPAYNEEDSLAEVINDIKTVMDKEDAEYKVLVVDDGSKDKTAQIAEISGAVVYSHPHNLGLAEAFRTEMDQCLKLGADIIVHTDADGQYQAKEIPLLIKEVQNGYDLVLGSRFAGKIEQMPWLKKFGNRAFSKAISKIIKYKVTDCQTGFRAFTKDVAKNIKITSGHTYTQEQIIRAVRQKYKIKEIPIFFAKRKSGESRLMKNPFEYAIRAWINILRIHRDYNPLKFFGSIGLVSLIAGLVLGFWLLYLFFTTGNIGGRYPTSILTALLVLSGIQIILFGFFADTKKK